MAHMADESKPTPANWQGPDDGDFTMKRAFDGHIAPSRTYEMEPADPELTDDLSNPYHP